MTDSIQEINKAADQPAPAADTAHKQEAGERRRPHRPAYKETTVGRVLIVAAAAELALALLLYILAMINPVLLAASAVSSAALILLSRLRPYALSRAYRVTLRVIFLLLLIGTAAVILSMTLYLNQVLAEYGITDPAQKTLNYVSMFAAIAMPFLFFLQLVLSVNAYRRHFRFDMVFLRIVSLVTLIGTLVLCLSMLDYEISGQPVILREVTYGSVTIALDHPITRALLCLCGAAATVCSFLLRSKEKPKEAEGTSTGASGTGASGAGTTGSLKKGKKSGKEQK